MIIARLKTVLIKIAQQEVKNGKATQIMTRDINPLTENAFDSDRDRD
ncbi:MAG: hypothetical protein LOD92_06210 [Bacillales bacterium]